MKSDFFVKVFHLEQFILNDVRKRFETQGFLNAFDFFCIILWKSNRMKSRIAGKFSERRMTIEAGVKRLTGEIHSKNSPEKKMRVLIKDWKFRLPTASAILAILYPDDFTIYDIRVCDALGDFHKLVYKVNFNTVWQGYSEFKQEVIRTAPEKSLRDKDRWLWGKSFCKQLEDDIKTGFKKKLPL
jgi:hypothetical protein